MLQPKQTYINKKLVRFSPSYGLFYFNRPPSFVSRGSPLADQQQARTAAHA